ncbi:uncharacterized protein MCYG_03824 [Microsporum canis CBS 113480]|uniref:Uncharacterized protein n=1 Tax=Arthroderma otae (strain ATCC MYA-4605 / CBS 113480) TaxID=554155 RepID=C5FMA2_ARTOC|nr:uncharacterized protein MCYG_03824 [Microsporum canis CBS 113480]EEQ31005.1 predicted protein [Microsporum canis CBS 113480]
MWFEKEGWENMTRILGYATCHVSHDPTDVPWELFQGLDEGATMEWRREAKTPLLHHEGNRTISLLSAYPGTGRQTPSCWLLFLSSQDEPSLGSKEKEKRIYDDDEDGMAGKGRASHGLRGIQLVLVIYDREQPSNLHIRRRRRRGRARKKQRMQTTDFRATVYSTLRYYYAPSSAHQKQVW